MPDHALDENGIDIDIEARCTVCGWVGPDYDLCPQCGHGLTEYNVSYATPDDPSDGD